MSAVALMGDARRIATDPLNARLALSPTAAVAVCLQQGRQLTVVPQGGEHARSLLHWSPIGSVMSPQYASMQQHLTYLSALGVCLAAMPCISAVEL